MKYDFESAYNVSLAWMEALRPYVAEVEIKGEIARGLEFISGIDLLVMPRFEPITDMFGVQVGRTNLLDDFCNKRNIALRTEDGIKHVVSGYISRKIPVSLWVVCDECQKGVISIEATGSAKFVERLFMHRCRGGAMPEWLSYKPGAVYHKGKILYANSEEDVFAAFELKFIPPRERHEFLDRFSLR
jgi:DNA polymerase/3'-5' exonuclease PolX